MSLIDPGPGEPAPSGLLQASAKVSLVTALARVAGFSRFAVLGLMVGTTYLGNAYETANWVPNIVFELVAGGVLSAVFVPTFVREMEHGRERGNEVASCLANTFLLLTIPMVVAGIFVARPIMGLLTVAVQDPAIRQAQIDVGSSFLYFFLPQIPLYVLAMVLTGMLHAHRRFLAPAAAPLWSSLVVIGAYVTFGSVGAGAGAELGAVTDAQRYVLAGGTTAGVFVLAFSQLPSVLRSGVRWRPVLGWTDPAVRRALRAGLAGVGYFGVAQVGLIMTLLLANRVQGGVVAYRMSFAFFELPKALIGLPIAAVLLPTLARRVARADEAGYARLLSQGWRAAFLIGAPAAAGLFVLAPELSAAVLSRAPSAAAPELVAGALRMLAIGVPAFVLVEPLIRSFFARHETIPPVAMNAVSVGVFAAVTVPLTLLLLPVGSQALEFIGLGNAVGQWFGAVLGTLVLASRVRGWSASKDIRFAGASLVRAAVMAGVVFAVTRLVPIPELAAVVGVLVGVAVYLVLNARTPEIRDGIRWLRS